MEQFDLLFNNIKSVDHDNTAKSSACNFSSTHSHVNLLQIPP